MFEAASSPLARHGCRIQQRRRRNQTSLDIDGIAVHKAEQSPHRYENLPLKPGNRIFIALDISKMRDEALTRRAPVCAPHAAIWMTFMDVNLGWLAAATILAMIALIVALPDVGLVSDDGEASG